VTGGVGAWHRRIAAVLCTCLAPSLAPAQQALPSLPRLRFLTSARQLGPVGYRDPVGAVSPDGSWLAYTSGGNLLLTHISGGPVRQLGEPVQRIYELAWHPNAAQIAVRERRGDGPEPVWSVYDVASGSRRDLWGGQTAIQGTLRSASDVRNVRRSVVALRGLSWSPDGLRVAGVIVSGQQSELWVISADGSEAVGETHSRELSFPAWSPDGASVACLAQTDGAPVVTLPCGDPIAGEEWEAFGPIAFSPDGARLYYSHPNDHGTVDLHVRPLDGGDGVRLTSFARDSYAPSVTRDGRVVFGVQDYRTLIAAVPADGGTVRQITAFQSETPSWSPDGTHLGFTFGSWRRVADDLHYPDIAQHLGIVPSSAALPAAAPWEVVRATASEDQGMTWSPGGRWIALHSHAEGSDDIWIQPADGSSSARRVTSGGHETGWPRWSPDGAWIAFGSDRQEGNAWRGTPFILPVDPRTGSALGPARRVILEAFDGDVDQVEWTASSDSLVFDAFEGIDRRGIYVVSRTGGRPRPIHRFASEHRVSGLGVSPDFAWVVFVAPGPNGRLQLFKVETSGGDPVQLTFDATDKTQPSVSPDGREIAFTVFHFSTQFWAIEP